MKTGELSRKVQAEAMPGNVFSNSAAVETFEDMLLCLSRNRTSGITDFDDRLISILARSNSDIPAPAIILAGVLEQILQDKSDVTVFSGDFQASWAIVF